MKLSEVDNDTWWGAFAMLVIAVFVTIGATAIVKDHPVRGYYLSSGASAATCVWIDVDWVGDNIAFCTNDINDAVAKVKELNASIKP